MVAEVLYQVAVGKGDRQWCPTSANLLSAQRYVYTNGKSSLAMSVLTYFWFNFIRACQHDVYFYLWEIPNIAYFYATQSNSDLLFNNQKRVSQAGLVYVGKQQEHHFTCPLLSNCFYQ